MDQFFKIWLLAILGVGFICLMSWIHRSWLKGFLATMVVAVMFVPFVYIIMVPMALLAHVISGIFPENLREKVFEGIGVGGTALITISLFVWYCVTQRQISDFTSAPANAYRSRDQLHPSPFRRKSL